MPLWKRSLLIIAGWTAVLLGVIGIFLPVLPTTPFLILAASCFAKSSTRFHHWLLSNPLLGPVIQDWQNHRSIKPKVKRWAICVVIATFAFSIYVVPIFSVKIFLVLVMIICLTFIVRLPERTP